MLPNTSLDTLNRVNARLLMTRLQRYVSEFLDILDDAPIPTFAQLESYVNQTLASWSASANSFTYQIESEEPKLTVKIMAYNNPSEIKISWTFEAIDCVEAEGTVPL